MARNEISKTDKFIHDVFIRESSDQTAVRQRLEKDGKAGINVSPVEGKLLQLLVGLVGAERVVEIGTLYGYSTLWIASALPKHGKVISLEFNPEHFEIARGHFESSELKNQIEIRLGDAKTILPTIEFQPDVVFIDADKPGYKDYVVWAMENVRVGGLIIGDNTLLFGHMCGEERGQKTSPAAIAAMKFFNETLANDNRFRATMIPTREGLTVAQKLLA
jgi:predicted O-methyltransferase YrrM